MGKKKRRINIYFTWALGASLFLHMLLLSTHLDIKNIIEKSPKRKIIKVVLIDNKEQKKEIQKFKQKQIVNTKQRIPKKEKIDSRFLGKTNQAFERETVSKSVGSFKEAGFGDKKGAKLSPKREVQKRHKKKEVAQKKNKNGKRRNKITLKDLFISKKTKPRKKMSPLVAPKGSKLGSKLQRGLARNNDFIEDIKIGDFTRLNTTEYKYFGFYDRIRKKLEQFWGNSLQEKAKKYHARGGRIPAGENKITSLTVTIDKKGNITNVFIKSTSGVSELDEAAVDSFNKAGPFPNPPKGMVVNGFAKIEWGFVVKS